MRARSNVCPECQTASTEQIPLVGHPDTDLAAVTDDFITRLATDPSLGKFFVGLNDTSKQRVRQHVINFLCNATGGPCLYLGQDMKTAHKGLHITEAEWNTSAQLLVDTLNKFKVPQPNGTLHRNCFFFHSTS